MKCPVCGGGMEDGELMTMADGRRVSFLWAPPEYFRKHTFNPFIRSKKSIEQDGEVKVGYYLPGGISTEMNEAYYCRRCKKLLVDFR